MLTYLRERIKEVLTGAAATIVIRIYGPNLDVLRGKAAEVAGTMRDIEGVSNLQVEPQVQVPQVEIKMRPDAALRRWQQARSGDRTSDGGGDCRRPGDVDDT